MKREMKETDEERDEERDVSEIKKRESKGGLNTGLLGLRTWAGTQNEHAETCTQKTKKHTQRDAHTLTDERHTHAHAPIHVNIHTYT